MQEPTLQQQIREYESNMPSEILDLIKSFDWRKELRSIVAQNQVMIDVGSDLEESTYLMILGIVTVEDVYKRLIEVHEYSEDKTKKILEEIEVRIFNQLSKKLQVLDEKEVAQEKESIVTQAYSGSGNEGFGEAEQITGLEGDSRDSILAEIEKEPAPIITQFKPQSNTPSARPMEISSQGQINKAPLSNSFSQDSGVRKPFSMADQKDSDMMNMPNVETEIVKPVIGIQEDPMAIGFKNPTVMENKKVEEGVKPLQNQAQRVVDPYREPIE